MESLKEIFSFSRAETIALSLLLTISLVGGGILIYENSLQSMPPQLLFESLSAGTPQQASSSEYLPNTVESQKLSAESPEPKFQRTRNLVLDINTAPAESLALLPFIGQTLSQRIVDYRTKHGAFTSVDQLISVYGIGPKNIEKMRPYLNCD